MRPSISFSLLSISLLCFFNLHGSTGQTLIHNTCKTCSQNNPNVKFDFCTTSLQAAPASECAGLHGLGLISIRLVRYNLTDTRCKVKQLLKNAKLDPFVKICLKDCFELYSDALDTVKQAMRHYNSQRFADANIEISAVMAAASTCEDGFGEKSGVVSPLTKRNRDVLELSAMVLSIMRMIQNGSQ